MTDHVRDENGMIILKMPDTAYNKFIARNIFVSVKTHYGNTLYYPACEITKMFAAIANTTTLTRSNLTRIKQLGYTVNVRAEQLESIEL